MNLNIQRLKPYHPRHAFRTCLLAAGICVLIITGCSTPGPKDDPANWAVAGGNAGETKYSRLDQINKTNVAGLQVAWTYNSGNKTGNAQCNPLIIEGRMYITTPAQELIAIDAANGKEIWRFNPARKGEGFGGQNRGIAYWKSGEAERILYTSGSFLNAVDIKTGKPATAFGDSGRVSMNDSLVKPAAEMNLMSPAAPVIFNNLVIIGGTSWTAPSNVSAFDINTGKRAWIFNTIPHPGEYGYDTWGNKDFWKKGVGVNVWGGLCVDEKNGMVYFATGQPKDDFYRANNKGAQLYGNSVVALDAASGKRAWHYQVVHHDIWDLDLPCAPVLVNLQQEGKTVPGLMQLSKTGNIFLFNRITGALLSKAEERAVPASTLPGEYSYATQPYVTWPEPFSRQLISEADLTNLTPEDHAAAKKVFDEAQKGWFLPPSEKSTLYYGIHGGAEWGGGAYDEKENVLIVNANELAWNITLKNIYTDTTKAPEYRALGFFKFLDKNGYPATTPPWGTLNAVDLTTGKIKWKVPLGEYDTLTKQGIPVTGTENFGGSIVTAGGLVFIGATRDEKFRAFDKDNGKILWETKLPYGGFTTPATYAIKGKQYIIIPATGGGKLGTKTGDAYVAYALPNQPSSK